MIKNYLITLRLDGMRSDIHFSIAFNSDSEDLNLHVTRNQTALQQKARIEIFRINKKELEELCPVLTDRMWNLIWRPLCLNTFKKKRRLRANGVRFYPFDALENTKNTAEFKNSLLSTFRQLATTKKNRLKIKGDIEQTINKVLTDNTFTRKLLPKFQGLPRKFPKRPVAGFIISNQFTGCVICSNNHWYGLREDIQPVDFLSAWMGPDLAKHVVFKILMAYARITQVDSIEESKLSENSIRLYKITA